MKPKYIFSAVFAVCLLLGGLLPRLSAPRASAAAQSSAPVAQASTLAPLPITPTQADPPSARQPAQALAKIAAAQQPAAAPPASPTNASPAGGGSALVGPSLAATASSAAPAKAPSTGVALPDLKTFAASLTNGQANQLVGVYAPDLFALNVVQQPGGDDQFVSTADQTVTQYGLPARYGVVGLLAHNTLSGVDFFGLKNGQSVTLIYGDGRQVSYKITASQRYQALSPTDNHSDFVDLNGPGGGVMNYQQLFERVYTHANQIVFQTCFEANGDPSWGRVFYIAEPV